MEKNLGCEPGTCRNETVIDEFIRVTNGVEGRFTKKPGNETVGGEVRCVDLMDVGSECLGKICTAELVETQFYNDGEQVPAPENLAREIPNLRAAESMRRTPAPASQPAVPMLPPRPAPEPELASWS